MTKNTLIILLVASILLGAISLTVVIVSACFTASALRVAPRPLDSFWSIDLGVTLLVIFSILFIAAVIGGILFARELYKSISLDR